MNNQPDKDDVEEGQSTEPREGEDRSADDEADNDENKRSEGHGNLHRRSDWFQKRHGGG